MDRKQPQEHLHGQSLCRCSKQAEQCMQRSSHTACMSMPGSALQTAHLEGGNLALPDSCCELLAS